MIIFHGSIVSSNCYIGPKALVGAFTYVDDNVFVGQSSTIISGKVDTVWKYPLVGAGSLVTKPVPINVVVVGNPAQFIKHRFVNI